MSDTSDTSGSIQVTVDGAAHQLDVDPDMPLLWVLRDVLGVTGVKYGCGQALCGACVVHVDGRAVRSCVTPIRRVRGAAVTTIAGLAPAPRVTDPGGAAASAAPSGDHPLQRAWIELGVPQCGFCQAGQIMTAAAMLAARPASAPPPSDDEIDHAMAGNLCRCGTYPRIRAAIKRAAGGGAP